MRGFTWVLGVVGMLGLASGCGGDSGDPTPPMSVGVAGSSAMRACNYSCTCENGLIGNFDCDTNACNCSACPSFVPPDPPPFEACGGDPTGVWRLADYKLGPFKLSITSVNGAVTSCLGQRPDATKPTEMYLELKANA